MSQYLQLNDQTLWNPSNGVARLFLRQVGLFKEELGVPSGIGPMVDDECQIDPAAFAVFVNALLAQHRRTTHAVVLALSEGFAVTVLALAERAGIEADLALPGTTSSDPSDPSDPNGPVEDLPGSARVRVPPSGMASPRASQLRDKSRELGRFMIR